MTPFQADKIGNMLLAAAQTATVAMQAGNLMGALAAAVMRREPDGGVSEIPSLPDDLREKLDERAPGVRFLWLFMEIEGVPDWAGRLTVPAFLFPLQSFVEQGLATADDLAEADAAWLSHCPGCGATVGALPPRTVRLYRHHIGAVPFQLGVRQSGSLH